MGNGVDEVAAVEGADGVGIVYPKRRWFSNVWHSQDLRKYLTFACGREPVRRREKLVVMGVGWMPEVGASLRVSIMIDV